MPSHDNIWPILKKFADEEKGGEAAPGGKKGSIATSPPGKRQERRIDG